MMRISSFFVCGYLIILLTQLAQKVYVTRQIKEIKVLVRNEIIDLWWYMMGVNNVCDDMK